MELYQRGMSYTKKKEKERRMVEMQEIGNIHFCLQKRIKKITSKAVVNKST